MEQHWIFLASSRQANHQQIVFLVRRKGDEDRHSILDSKGIGIEAHLSSCLLGARHFSGSRFRVI